MLVPESRYQQRIVSSSVMLGSASYQVEDKIAAKYQGSNTKDMNQNRDTDLRHSMGKRYSYKMKVGGRRTTEGTAHYHIPIQKDLAFEQHPQP
jgi:hypothetical protein